MKNRFLILTISATLGIMVVYGLMELASFIHRMNNPEYVDMVNELIPDLGLILMFFIAVYPYQFIVRTLQQQLERRGFSEFRTSFIILLVSIFLYSIGFTIIFRSPHLGILDTIQTFGLGTLIFGVYFLINLSTHHFMSNIGTKKSNNA